MLTIVLLGLVAIAPFAPRANAVSVSNTFWLNATYNGDDPFYGTTVAAYKTGSTATLAMVVSNAFGSNYINITGAKLTMDWNANYTGSMSPTAPQRINQNAQQIVSINFVVPDTNTATNLATHFYTTLYINYTMPGSPGTRQLFPFATTFAVYNSDQASAMLIVKQLGLLSLPFGASLCGAFGTTAFKTAMGNADCQQAIQKATLAMSQYKSADFANANTNFQAAQTDWNNAVSADSTTGGAQDISASLSGWGGLLLGIGGLIAGISALMYTRRGREPRSTAATTTHT